MTAGGRLSKVNRDQAISGEEPPSMKGSGTQKSGILNQGAYQD